jgi:hypothetical protein
MEVDQPIEGSIDSKEDRKDDGVSNHDQEIVEEQDKVRDIFNFHRFCWGLWVILIRELSLFRRKMR